MAATQKKLKRPSVDLIAGGNLSELREAGKPTECNMRSASALVHVNHNAAVMKAHEAYLTAGASWLVTSNRDVVPGVGFKEEEIRQYSQVAGHLAHLARQLAKREATARIIGSLPPLLPGYRADRNVSSNALDVYSLIAEALMPYVDAFIAEGMSSTEEALEVTKAVGRKGKPIIVSFKVNSHGYLQNGENVVDAIQSLLSKVYYDLEAVTFNCSRPEDISKALQCLQKAPDLMQEIKARKIRLGGFAGRLSDTSTADAANEKLIPGATLSVLDKQEFYSFFQDWINHGATIVGGCCGVPPSYYRYARDELDKKLNVAP